MPPSPAEELPDLVRFQAQRQFPGLGDDWSLDFLPIQPSETDEQSVLAAAISPELVKQIPATCRRAGLDPRRLVLRPCAAASLLQHHHPLDRRRPCLMVDLLTGEADLTVLLNRTVVFMRTVRLPLSLNRSEQRQALIGEIRRTIVAAQNQLGATRVRDVVLCGNGTEESELKSFIEGENLRVGVELFDPFGKFDLSEEVRSRPPDSPGRFAPLLGMLRDEILGQGSHAIDFLNPRRRPKTPDRRRAAVAALVVAGLLLTACVVVPWMLLAKLDARIGRLQSEAKQLDRDIARGKKTIDRAAELDRWVAGDVDWLDQLRRLSAPDGFPAAEKAKIDRFQAGSLEKGGGEMVIDGSVDHPETIGEMETALRAADRRVAGKGSQQDGDDPAYPWEFSETIWVLPTPENAREADSQPGSADGGTP